MQGVSVITRGWIIPVHLAACLHQPTITTVEVRPKVRYKSQELVPPDASDKPVLLQTTELKPIQIAEITPPIITIENKPMNLSTSDLKPIITKSKKE
jgi:hypothetical protein